MKNLLCLILFIPILLIGNNIAVKRYTIINNDTLEVKPTFYGFDKNGDSLFQEECKSFGILGQSKFLNYMDDKCMKQGFWKEYNSYNKLYSEGNYINNKRNGMWYYYSNYWGIDTIKKIEYNLGEKNKIYTIDGGNRLELKYSKSILRYLFNDYRGILLFILLLLFYSILLLSYQINKLKKKIIRIRREVQDSNTSNIDLKKSLYVKERYRILLIKFFIILIIGLSILSYFSARGIES